MSMAVDLSKPLTSQEREYLAGRGRYAELERSDAMHGVTGQSLPEGDGSGPISQGTASFDVRDARIVELERQLALLKGTGVEAPEDDTEDGEVDPYETWTVADLDAELKRRNLAVTGNKDSKIRVLYQDDETGS